MLLSIRRIAITVVALVLLSAPRAGAQDWSKLFSDPEVENYQLTIEQVRRYVDLLRIVASDPQTMAKLDQDYKELQQRNPKPTVAEVAAVAERAPAVRAAFAKANVTPREYLLQTAAVSNAAIQLTMRNRGMAPKTAAQKANVALLEKHQDEWNKLQAEMTRLAEASNARIKSKP
jgi:hypothetical protein